MYFNIVVVYVVDQSYRMKLVVSRLVKRLYTFCATGLFIAVFKRARHSPELHDFIPRLHTRFQKCSFNTLKCCVLVSSPFRRDVWCTRNWRFFEGGGGENMLLLLRIKSQCTVGV
jgi:hypothetical protein